MRLKTAAIQFGEEEYDGRGEFFALPFEISYPSSFRPKKKAQG
jgi:hypothetical protein